MTLYIVTGLIMQVIIFIYCIVEKTLKEEQSSKKKVTIIFEI